MSLLESASPQYSPKPYWTATKIVAVVLVAIVAVSSLGAGVYYYAILPERSSNLRCGNGATDYPSCSMCPSGQALVGASCHANCTNEAANPPFCDQCANGTNNPPQCTKYSTSVSLSCAPTDGNYSSYLGGANQGPYGGYCTAAVDDFTIPTGTVAWSGNWTMQNAWSVPNSCTLSGTSSSTAECGAELTPPPPTNGFQTSVNVTANYQGDNNHTSSLGSYTMTAPSNVTLNGTVNISGCTACILQVVISNVGTTQTWSITSSTCQSPTYWCFTVSLPNLQDYTVQITGISPAELPPFNSSCSNTTNMNVYQFSAKANGQFVCFSPA